MKKTAAAAGAAKSATARAATTAAAAAAAAATAACGTMRGQSKMFLPVNGDNVIVIPQYTL